MGDKLFSNYYYYFFLAIPLSNPKAFGGLEVPDLGDLLEGSDKKGTGNSKKSSPLESGIGLIKTLTDEETVEEELEAGKIYASRPLGLVKKFMKTKN